MAIRILITVAALQLLAPVLATQTPLALSIRVLSEDGASLPAAVATVNGQRVSADGEGTILLPASRAAPLQILIAAPGHYPMVHTLMPGATVPDIRLVRKTAGRRLLLFAGDSMLGRRFFAPRGGEPALVSPAHVIEDGKQLLRYVKPYVELADIASANLETPLSSTKLTNPAPKSVTFFSPDALAMLLEWTGFDYVALGNNHTFDYRDPGIRSTFRALEKTGLAYSGAGFDAGQARQPYTTSIDGRSIAFLSYVGWPGTVTPTQTARSGKGGAALGTADVLVTDIAAIDDKALTVLQFHSGIEYAEQPALTKMTNLRTAVDAGADVAIGHHPHVTQGLEIYRDRLIAYSLGNFLFDQYIYSTQAGMLLYVWMDGDTLYRAEIVPLNINGYVPTPATGAFRYSVLSRLARLSRRFGTCLKESGAHAILGTGIECGPDDDSVVVPRSGENLISLYRTGLSPLHPAEVAAGERQYRFGNDLLARGDFEAAGLFSTPVRAWEIGDKVHVVHAMSVSGQELQVVLEDAAPVRTGMKVFERAFRRSNPSTVSGSVRADGPVTMRFYLQRRPLGVGLDTALKSGPSTEIATVTVAAGGRQSFSLDHDLPRIATKSIRLIVEVQSDATAIGPVSVYLDDLAWIEWRTPWLRSSEAIAAYATHVQLRNPIAPRQVVEK